MLKVLRKKGVAKKILWVVAVIIILSFGFFGTANYYDRGNGNITYAGEMFGRKISFDQFQKSLFQARIQAIMAYGDNFNKVSQLLDLESVAWDRLIMLEEARRKNIKVSDTEVVAAVQNLNLFKNNGSFDPAIYEKIVNYYFRTKPRDFEEGIRQSLILQKLSESVTTGISVSEEDLLKEYKNKNEQIQVSYVLFAPKDDAKQIVLTPEEALKYYQDNKQDFFMPPSVNVEYLYLPVAPELPEKDKNDIAAKVTAITEDLTRDPNLPSIAEKHKVETGESGFFSHEQPPLKLGWPFELLQKIFSLEDNEVSGPVETAKGYYFVRLKEKKDSYIPEYAEVEEKVKEALGLEKARDISRSKAEEALKNINQTIEQNPEQKFSAIAKTLNLSVSQTKPFTRGQYLDNLGVVQEFQDAAFALIGTNRVSPVVEISKGFCIISVDNFVPIDEEKFKKEKEDFSKAVLAQKKNSAVDEFIERLRIKANLQDNIKALKEMGEQQL
ncbi:MAG: SurA N-terminal domain-containing protein [Candidatus Omnitrophota bacterium]